MAGAATHPAVPFCLTHWAARSGDTQAGPLHPPSPQPGGPGPQAAEGAGPGSPLRPPSRLGPSSASRSGHGVSDKNRDAIVGKVWVPDPVQTKSQGTAEPSQAVGSGGAAAGCLHLPHARDPRAGTVLSQMAAASRLGHAAAPAPPSQSDGRSKRRTCLPAEPTHLPGTGSEEAWGLAGPGGRGRGTVTCQPARPVPKLPASCAPVATTGEDPEAGALDHGHWECRAAPAPWKTGR